jgi:hypothetical protein
MGRLVDVKPRTRERFFPKAVAGTDDPEPDDSVITRVLKFVPTEIVAGYIPLVAAVEAMTDDPTRSFTLACVALSIGFIGTPLYLILVGKPKGWIKWLNVGISTVAFVLWAYLLGGPFAMDQMNQYLWAYDKHTASFAVGVFTWIMALIPFKKLAS